MLYGLVAIGLFGLFFWVPTIRRPPDVFVTIIRYGMPAYVLSQCAVLNLSQVGRIASPMREVIVCWAVCLSVIGSLASYFLPLQVAGLVVIAFGAGTIGVLAQRVHRRLVLSS